MSTDTSIPSRSFLIMSEISTTCAQRHPRAQRSDALRAGSRRSAAAPRSTRGAHPALVELNRLDEGDGDGVRRMLRTHVRAHAPEELMREAEDQHVRLLRRARVRLSAAFRSARSKAEPEDEQGAENASVIDGSQNLTTARRRRKRAQGTGRQETLTASFTSAMATILVGSLIPGRYLTFSCSCPPRAPRQRQVLTSW
jgi:hypothetical protein